MLHRSNALGLVGLSVALLTITAVAPASPIIIDSFSAGSGAVQAYAGHETDILVTTGADFGWNRTLQIDSTPAATGNTGDGFARQTVSSGVLVMGTMTYGPTYCAEFNVFYDNGGATIDLVDDDGAPNDGILIEFDSADHGYDLTLTLSSGSAEATVTKSLSANESPHNVFIAFSELTADAGFDLAAVDLISVSLLGEDDGDYRIDRISAVSAPEPMTMGLLGLGGLALARRRRR